MTLNIEIIFQETLTGITTDMLRGFFVGWPTPPTPETHLRLLQSSDLVILALAPNGQSVIGFITAITDGVTAAYIPHLEVLPAYQGKGIGSELVQRMFARLKDIYMIDLVCDEPLRPFYENLGMIPLRGMVLRNYAAQSGIE